MGAKANPYLVRKAERYVNSLLNRVTPEELAKSMPHVNDESLEEVVALIRSARVEIRGG